MSGNNLSQYLQLLMERKGLTATDVERRCNKRITNSYIGRIIRGEVTNLTVETIGALAEGLDVDPYELFAIAYGKPPQKGGVATAIDPLALVEALHKLVMNPQLIEVLEVWEGLLPEHQASLLSSLKSFQRQEAKKPKKPHKKP